MTTASDIEIYITQTDCAAVEAWLKTMFQQVTAKKKVKGVPKNCTAYSMYWQGQEFNAFIFENVEPGFTSVWFDTTLLPWQNDELCAAAAALFFNQKVRITAGSWAQSANPDAWVDVAPDGQKTDITWSLS